MNTKLIRTKSAFLDLKHQWDQLFELSGCTNPYLTWDWMHEWWRHYHARLPRGAQLVILALYDGEQLMALLPLYRARRIRSQVPFDYLKVLGDEFESSEYPDILCHPSQQKHGITAILGSETFHRAARGIDFLEISYLREESLLYRHRNTIAHLVGGPVYANQSAPYLSLPLPATEEEFLQGLSRNMRGSLRAKQRKIDQQDGISVERVTDPAQLDQSVEELFRLHGLRFDVKGAASGFDFERRGGFTRVTTRRFLERDWLRLYLVRQHERAIAALYCLQVGDQLMYLQSGFDPEYNELGLGNLLLFWAMQNGIAEGIRTFDFLRGNEDYKYRWTKDEFFVHRLTFPMSFKGRSSLRLFTVLNSGRSWMENRLGLAGRVS